LPHLSELHGAATHLAVVALPVYLIVLLCRRAGVGGPALAQLEPWVVAAALAGTLLAGATGLLVWGQAQTQLRGGSFRLGTAHFWLGIALTVIVVALAAWRLLRVRQARDTHGRALVAGGIVALMAVVAQGYLGGRMTYDQGVGVAAGGQFARSAAGTAALDAALARGARPADAGRTAFARGELGCASCHGDQAQGLRGPRLSGGAELEQFRRVHGDGLFPPTVVSDAEFAAVNAWLRTLPRPAPGTRHAS
jgi:mono/diheme cytochrome c family protein